MAEEESDKEPTSPSPDKANELSKGKTENSAEKKEDTADEKPKKEADDKAPDDKGPDGESDKDKAGEKDKKPSISANPKVGIAIVVAAILIVVGLIALYSNYRSYGRFQQSTTDAYLAADQVSVASRVSGYVEQVFVTDNQLVRRGQILVRIDARTYVATAQQYSAQISQARATLAQARAQRVQQYDQIRQSSAQADQSRATLELNRITARFNADQVARYSPLSAAGAETAEKLAQNTSSLKQSLAQVASARAQLAASNAQVSSSRHQIAIDTALVESGAAQVASARAQLAASMVDVEAADVVSRIAGRIGSRTVRVGQYVPAGTRLMTVVPVETLYLVANFKETQIGLMRIGQPATIEVDALPGDVLHGVVESFSPGTGSRFAQVPTDNATGNFTKIVQRVPVRIRIDAGAIARMVLVPGLSVTASVDTRGARDERSAQKDEGKRSKDVRKQENTRDVERDRTDPGPGPGK